MMTFSTTLTCLTGVQTQKRSRKMRQQQHRSKCSKNLRLRMRKTMNGEYQRQARPRLNNKTSLFRTKRARKKVQSKAKTMKTNLMRSWTKSMAANQNSSSLLSWVRINHQKSQTMIWDGVSQNNLQLRGPATLLSRCLRASGRMRTIISMIFSTT